MQGKLDSQIHALPLPAAYYENKTNEHWKSYGYGYRDAQKDAADLMIPVQQLLAEIRDWMMDNDYECGPHGSKIHQKITKIIGYEE